MSNPKDRFGTFQLAYIKSVEYFNIGVFIELVRLNYGLDYHHNA